MKIISVCNQKGGCAKTTTAINISYGLAEKGNKVLVIDNDYQANLTEGFGIIGNEHSLYDCFINELELEDLIIKSPLMENLDIIPCADNYSNVDIAFAHLKTKNMLLNDLLAKYELDYDYIIIDCSPSLNTTVLNALAISDSILITAEPASFSKNALIKLMETIDLVQKSINPGLKIEGVLLTRVDARTKSAEKYRGEIEKELNVKVFNTEIHQSSSIEKGQSVGLPATLYAPKSKSAKEYNNFVEELLK